MEDKLVETASTILFKYLGARKNSKILLVNDHEPNTVYDSFKKALELKGVPYKEAKLSIDRKPSEPIYEIVNDLLASKIVIAPTAKSITHCPETRKAAEKGAKIITMPGITEQIFLKINETDLKAVEKEGRKIVKQLRGKNKVEVNTPNGTKLFFSIKKRDLIGLKPKTKGFVENLPLGEIFCAPIEESADGELFIDHWRDTIKPEQKAWLKIENGRISEWNTAAEPYVKEHSVENGLIIAEFGIGTNRAHKAPIGNILHDEKIFGSVHIAFGNNVSFGGKNKSPIHSDIILLNPTVFVDGRKLEW